MRGICWTHCGTQLKAAAEMVVPLGKCIQGQKYQTGRGSEKKSMKQQGMSMKDHETTVQTPALEKKGAEEMSTLQPVEDHMLDGAEGYVLKEPQPIEVIPHWSRGKE